VAHAGNLPTGDMVAGQQRRKHQIHHIRFGGAETARRRHDRNVIFVGQHEQIARLDGREKPFECPANLGHGPADHVFGPRRCGRRSDQNDGGLGTQQMMQRAAYRGLILDARKDKTCAQSVAFQPLRGHVFEKAAALFHR